jgi:hypothetical protein
MGVHPRLGRGDAASGLSSSGGRFRARREITRLHIGRSHFLISAKVQGSKLTWNFALRLPLVVGEPLVNDGRLEVRHFA